MIPNFGELAGLMKNFGKIQEAMDRAAESLGQIQAEGSAGGGMVTARANGRMEVLSVRIDRAQLQDSDAELLEDLITAAVNQALSRAREEAARTMQGAGGALGLGGDALSRLFGPGR